MRTRRRRLLPPDVDPRGALDAQQALAHCGADRGRAVALRHRRRARLADRLAPGHVGPDPAHQLRGHVQPGFRPGRAGRIGPVRERAGHDVARNNGGVVVRGEVCIAAPAGRHDGQLIGHGLGDRQAEALRAVKRDEAVRAGKQAEAVGALQRRVQQRDPPACRRTAQRVHEPRLGMPVQQLQHEADRLLRRESLAEGRDRALGVLAEGDGGDVELEQEDEFVCRDLGQQRGQPGPVAPWPGRTHHGRHHQHGHGRLFADRVGHESRRDPDLVHQVEAVRPLFREAGRLPVPAADAIGVAHVARQRREHTRQDIRVAAEDGDRRRTRQPGARDCIVSDRRRRIGRNVVRPHRDAGGFQRRDALPRCLADANVRAQVAHVIDTRGIRLACPGEAFDQRGVEPHLRLTRNPQPRQQPGRLAAVVVGNGDVAPQPQHRPEVASDMVAGRDARGPVEKGRLLQRIAERQAFSDGLAVQRAARGVPGRAVAESGARRFDRAGLPDAGRLEGARIVFEQPERIAWRLAAEAVFVLRDSALVCRVAAEMEEDEVAVRLLAALHLPAPAFEAGNALMQVPVRDVEAGMLQHRAAAAQQQRRIVHPLLVGEDAFADVVQAEVVKLRIPPVEQPAHVRRIPHRGEAQVVEPGPHDREVVGLAAVIGKRREDVRGQDQCVVRFVAAPELVEPLEHADVRIEVDRTPRTVVEQEAKARGLDARGELEDVVVRPPVIPFLALESLFGGNDDEVLGQRQPLRRRIEQEDGELEPGVMLGDRCAEDTRMGQVVACGDREDRQLIAKVRLPAHGAGGHISPMSGKVAKSREF
ncbi:hypothetical protein APY03_5939 [Variovorax sp. WDL1]|nr:hypothetical protein APY03_5939 [Variovorax sp. WDL1]